VISEAVDRRRVDAEQRQVTLTIAGTTGSQVLGSVRQLGVAVGNLVENAVVYSDPGARVAIGAHVSSSGDDDRVQITVSDNGIGIPANEHERIFERFYRVDYARSRANGGTGLGLSIVKHIAAIHGGDVSVWSQVGRGSTFTIELPAHVPAQTPSVPLAAGQASSDEHQEVNR
jgi:two-component system sensor histidine kinase SenX3